MHKYYATFADEHRHPITGERLGGYYVTINAVDEEAARFAMFQLFHDNWAVMYNAAEFDASRMGSRGELASCDAKPFNLET
jgi:hypothetical protein